MPSTKARILGEAVSATGPINSTRAVTIVEATSSDGVLSRDGGIINYATVNDLPASGLRVGQQAFVTATSRIYMYNGAGWFSTALINATPAWDSNGQPSASYVLDADSPQDATVITLAAIDPEGFTVTYNHITGGSMDSIATVSQDSSVFTITPKTHAALGDGIHTGSITFRATDGVNILPYVSSFTLTFVSAIVNSKYIRALVRTTNASDNNNITDSSSSSHTVTASGDPNAGTFSPYRNGGYAVEFDGSDYLKVADSDDFHVSSSADFTLESWVYLTNLTANNQLVDTRPSGGNGDYFTVAINTSNKIYMYSQSATKVTSAASVPLNQWVHVSYVRASNTGRWYINGTADTNTWTDNIPYHTSATGADWWIGTRQGSAGSWFTDAKIRDFRFVNGTAIIPPSGGPTEPLTVVTNTKLLACSLPYIGDASPTPKTITVSGDPKTVPTGPYDYKEYSVSDGGSIHFDGSGDWLQATASSDFAMGADNFTAEAWIYPTVAPSPVGGIFDFGAGVTATRLSMILYNDRRIKIDNNGNMITSVSTISLNAWSHIALVREGTGSNESKLYINGVLDASGTIGSMTDTNCRIGAAVDANEFIGNISDVRIVKGSTIYTSNFVPPTAPLTAVTNTKLLLKGTDASVIDLSQSSNIQLINNAVGSTTQVKFAGSKSIDLTQNDAHIKFPDPSGDGLGTAFTMESWIYLTQWNGYETMFHETGTSAYLAITSSGSGFEIYNPGVSQPIFTSCGFVLNTWFHWALCRDAAGAWYLFRDGNRITTGNSAINQNDLTRFADAGTEFKIGSKNNNSTQDLSGYIQEFRINDGLAKYTSNFTPPVAEFEG